MPQLSSFLQHFADVTARIADGPAHNKPVLFGDGRAGKEGRGWWMERNRTTGDPFPACEYISTKPYFFFISTFMSSESFDLWCFVWTWRAKLLRVSEHTVPETWTEMRTDDLSKAMRN